MSSKMFRELALLTCRIPGIYHFSLYSFGICIVRYEKVQGFHVNVTCYTTLTYTSHAAHSSVIIKK